LQKSLDIVASKALDSPDRVTGQFAPSDQPIDGHWRELQQVSELSNSIELRLSVVFQSRSMHSFTSPSLIPSLTARLSFENESRLLSF
jgi:hypothetical protein